MKRILRRRRVLAVVGLLAFAAAGGGAYAATQSGSSPRQAFLNDVAKRLHVSPQRLTAAVKAALLDRLEAAVRDGRITQAQANAIKQRIENSGPLAVPFLGPPGFAAPRAFPVPPVFFGGRAGPLAAAAGYLGLSEARLFNDLRSGQSLAKIASGRGKSVAGLERAMAAAIKSGLDRAASAGRITKAEERQLLSRWTSRLHDFIYQAGPPRPPAGPPLGAPPGPRPPAGPPLGAPPVGPWHHYHEGSVPPSPAF
jgi:AraC-like DNA-binding protein